MTTGVGKYGVVGLLENGEGPTVMLRADMDALPVRENTSLPYASAERATDREGNEVPVAHACGHDMHTTCLVGVTALMAQATDAWSGTLIAVFQPAGETGLFDRFPKPDVVLGQHVMPTPACTVSYRPGTTQSASDSLEIRMFGRGGHGSMPETAVDPVVMAASTVLRLQTIVSREIAPTDAAVLTVGALQAGTKENVIPDEATIKLNVRTFDEGVRKSVLDAIERMVNAVSDASDAPKRPEITPIARYPLTVNDPDATRRVAEAFGSYFDHDHVEELSAPFPASEAFGSFGTKWHAPSVFRYIGGTDPDTYDKAKQAGRVARDIPTNHSPNFAPVIHPTLETGVEAMVVAARAWLSS